jgi:hypothetical protein
VFLKLASQIEGQLREAYDCQYQAGLATQASVAKKLGIDRATVHRRLTGQTNMTMETNADMVWALDYAINVKIFDPAHATAGAHNFFPCNEQPVPSPKETPKSELPPELRDLLKPPTVVGT